MRLTVAVLVSMLIMPAARAADFDPLVARFAAALAADDVNAFESFRADLPIGDEAWFSVRDTFEKFDCLTVRSGRITGVSGDDRSKTIRVVFDVVGTMRGERHPVRRIAPDWTLGVVRDEHDEWRLRFASTTARFLAHRMLDGNPLAAEEIAFDPAFAAHELCDVSADVFVMKPGDPRGFDVLRFGMETAASSGDTVAQCYCWRMSSHAETFVGHHDAAVAQAGTAIAIAEQAGLPDEIAPAYFMRAIAEWYGGWQGEAIADMRHAAEMIGQTDDPGPSLRGWVMLQNFLQSRGDLHGALTANNRLIEYSKRYGWPEGEADGVTNAGIIYLVLREYDIAAEQFIRAEALFRAIRNDAFRSMAIYNRALVVYAKGERKEASRLLKEAIAFQEAGNVRSVMDSELATVLRTGGDLAGAEAAVDRALAEIGPGEGRLRSYGLSELSRIRRAQRRPREAIALAKQAIAARAQIGMMNVGETSGQVRVDLALAVRDAGRKKEAIKLLREAIDTIEKERVAVSLDVTNSANFFRDYTEPYIALATLLTESRHDDEAFRVAERMRARALSDAVRQGRSDDAATMTDHEKAQGEELNARIATLNRALLAARDPAEKKRLRRDLDDARLLLDQHRTDMLITYPELRLRPLEASRELKAVEGTAIIEYAVADKQTLAFVVTSSNGKRQTRAYTLPVARKELARLTKKLDDMIAAHDLDYGSAARRLYAMLLAPLEGSLEGQPSICVVPHDVLWRVPFHVLIDGRGSAVVDRFALFYAPSVAMLTSAMSHRGPRPQGPLLAFGNASLDAAVEGRMRAVYRDVHLGPLIDAEREVREIGRLYDAPAAAILTRGRAREETFKRVAPRFRVIHIATHGIVDDRAPMYSALALTASPNGDDGLLEAREILAMNLHADLAVLSACDTARGSIAAGEGVIGLAWAFLVAGCPSTVVSQWEAESASTSVLMIEFHRRLRAGASKPEALRQAALALRRDRRYAHPFYWAPFIVVGAP